MRADIAALLASRIMNTPLNINFNHLPPLLRKIAEHHPNFLGGCLFFDLIEDGVRDCKVDLLLDGGFSLIVFVNLLDSLIVLF